MSNEFKFNKDDVDAFMEKRGFHSILWGMQGNNVSSIEYAYHSNNMAMPDMSYSCTVYLKDGTFEFFFVVPKSISQLRCKASSIGNEKHFDRLNNKFKEQVEFLYEKFANFSYSS